MSEPSATLRLAIVAQLRLLASVAAQRAYERDVPFARVPAELACMWFDDLYHPDSEAFLGAFPARERLALADFHATFRGVLDAMPEAAHSVADLHARPEWAGLMRAAVDTLSRLGENAA